MPAAISQDRNPTLLADIIPTAPPPKPHRASAPLLPIAIGLIAGMTLDNALPVPLLATAAMMVIALAIFSRRARRFKILAILCAAAATGSLRHAIADRWVPQDYIGHYTPESPALVQLRGQVVDEPRKVSTNQIHSGNSLQAPASTRYRFLLDSRQIMGKSAPIPVSGLVTATVKLPANTPTPALSCHTGDTITMTGWLHRPMAPRNPGEYDWRLQNHRNGIDAAFSCEHAESIQRDAASHPTSLARRSLNSIRIYLRSYLIDPAFDPGDESGGILTAMVLGQRNEVSQTVNQAFIRTGNSHFLAASGTNVGWLAMFGWWVLMRLGGLHYRKVVLIIAALILLFLAVAEPQPSILRAAIIGLLGCWAIFRGGRRNLDNALACSAIIILLIDPNDLFRPAFQFSYLAVIAISKLEPLMAGSLARFCLRRNWYALAHRFDLDLYQLSLFDPAVTSTSVLHSSLVSAFFTPRMITMSIAAWLITLPLTCYHFNQFTPWGWFGTLILWFLIVPLTFFGFIAILFGIIIPPSSALFGPLLAAGTHATLWLVNLLAKIPFTLLPGRNPSIYWVIACYALLAWIMYARRAAPDLEQSRNSKQPKTQTLKSKIPAALALILLLWWAIPPSWTNNSRNTLNIWMLAVGGGTGTVIELPNGKVLLYDLGTRSDYDVGRTAAAFLSHRGITALDAVFISHTDADHLSGLTTLAQSIPIARVIINDHFEPMAAHHQTASDLLNTLRAAKIPIETAQGPQSWPFDPQVRIESLWPPPRDRLRFIEANPTSTVLRLEYQGRSILLPGDIESEAESKLLKDSPSQLHADVLALPHHGSVTPQTSKFIKTVNPSAIIRSTGQRAAMTTNGIANLAGTAKYLSTADDGCIHIEVHDSSLNIAAFSPP